MNRGALIISALVLLLAAAPLRAELRAGIGAFTLGGGLDVHLSYRPQHSHWMYGLRFARWTDEWETASGTALSATTTTKVGPTVNYLFRPESRGSWYVGMSLLHWTQAERSPRTGTSGTASKVAPFFGGGYTGLLGQSFYYHWGLFLSPAKLSTQTADSAEETTGADAQLLLGFTF